MTPETRLAQFLSTNEETQKIEVAVRGLSLEELEGLLKTGSVKTANGDMLQYFQDHPEKLKEKQERDAKKEKKAWSFPEDNAHHKLQKKSSSKTEDNESSASDIKAEMEKDEKLSPQDKLKKAEAMGRELAQKEKAAAGVVPFPKVPAGIKKVVGAAREYGAEAGKAVKENRGKVGLMTGALVTGKAGTKALEVQDEKHKKDMQALKKKHKEKNAALAFGAGKAMGALGNAAKAVGGAAKALPGAVKSAPGGIGAFLKKDLQATKQQFSAGMKGQARPALAKTPVPGIQHNAAPVAAPAAAKSGMGAGMKMGLMAGGVAAAAGAGMAGHAAMDKRQQQGVQKAASAEKVAVDFGKFKEPALKAAKTVGTKLHSGVKALGGKINSIHDPIIKGTAAGALIGGVGGVATGAILPDKDEAGKPQRGRTMMRRGIAGALSGAATGGITGAMQKSSSVKKLEAALEKNALGMAGIGSMAKNFVGSMKPVAEKAMGAVKPMAQQAMAAVKPMAQKALAHPMAQKAIGMAAKNPVATGAVAGGVMGGMAPGRDANGQQKSRLGGMARGAVGGAAISGLATGAQKLV